MFIINRALLKATIIVIPILGCTWVFGLLAVNEDTVVFAWIFTILNSLQVHIMIYYICACLYEKYLLGYVYHVFLCTEGYKGM